MIKKEWEKYLKTLEEIDRRVVNRGLDEVAWIIQVSYEAEKAGVPSDLIQEYLYGDLVVINGIPYNMNGKKLA